MCPLSDNAFPPVKDKRPRAMEGVTRPDFRAAMGELLTPLEIARLGLNWWRLPKRPRGYNHPVMLLPGFGAGERSMVFIKTYLKSLGYDVYDWGIGTNLGDVEGMLDPLLQNVNTIASDTNRPITLLGWSLGGYLAREIARERPDQVCHVVTLASPVVGGPKYTVTASLYERLGTAIDEIEAKVAERYDIPLSTPVTAFYSKRDGIVAWEATIDHWSTTVEHIEMDLTHLGFGASPDVLRLLANRLHRWNPDTP